MKLIYKSLLLLCMGCFVPLLTACRGGHSRGADIAGDTLALRYAEFLTIIEHEAYTEVQVHSPWNKGRLLQTVKVRHEEGNNNVKLYSCDEIKVICAGKGKKPKPQQPQQKEES